MSSSGLGPAETTGERARTEHRAWDVDLRKLLGKEKKLKAGNVEMSKYEDSLLPYGEMYNCEILCVLSKHKK